MPVNNAIAMARARASIQDLHTALSVGNGERLHADITGYCRALYEFGVISDSQWADLQTEASAALAERKEDDALQRPGGGPTGYS